MKHFKTPIIAGLAALSLAACATTPEPEPEVEETPVVEAPVEAAPTPAPVEVVEEPTIETVPFEGPTPGSMEDFLYQSGGDARVYFGYDRYELSPEAREVLRKQAEWLNLHARVTAVIEGNADERGTREYNLALGARRAESVKDFLVSQGVASNRLTTVSYGKERPIDPRSNAEGWAKNRNGHTNLISGTIG